MEETQPTLAEVQAAYPECAEVIAMLETHEPLSHGFDRVIRGGLSPHQVAEAIRKTARQNLENFGDVVDGFSCRKILAEIEHPSFMQYLCGRLGAL